MPLRLAQLYVKSGSVDCLESVALFGAAELSKLGIFSSILRHNLSMIA